MVKNLLIWLKNKMSTKKNKYKKVFSVIFLLFLLGILLYLTFNLENRSVFIVKHIEIKGADHLTKEQYFKYANFDHIDDYKYLNLTIIKDRIIKHPYIKDADVEFEGNDKVVIDLIEKNFNALYYTGNKQYMVTENLELVPQLPFTRQLDYPIITNSLDDKKYKPFFHLTKTDDLINGLKIVSSFKIINEDLYNKLSEIDLNNGKSISLVFSVFDYLVYVGREDVIKRVVYFDNFYNSVRENLYSSAISHVDLRFDKNIYMQLNVPVSDAEDKKLWVEI